jgi:hypothetical protein
MLNGSLTNPALSVPCRARTKSYKGEFLVPFLYVFPRWNDYCCLVVILITPTLILNTMAKSIFLLAMLVLAWNCGFSQDRIKEIGLTFQSFDDFGINYKVGRPDALWRFNSVFISGGKSESSSTFDREEIQKSFGIGVGIGREFRKPVVENLQFRYGVDITFNYYTSESKQINPTEPYPYYNKTVNRNQYRPGLAFILGVNYIIKEKFIIGAEILPGVYYSTEEEATDYHDSNEVDTHLDSSGFGFQGSLSSAMLTFAYRFKK